MVYFILSKSSNIFSDSELKRSHSFKRARSLTIRRSWRHLLTCPSAASSLLLFQRLDLPLRVIISIAHLIRLIFVRSRWSGEDHFGISFVLFVVFVFLLFYLIFFSLCKRDSFILLYTTYIVSIRNLWSL